MGSHTKAFRRWEDVKGVSGLAALVKPREPEPPFDVWLPGSHVSVLRAASRFERELQGDRFDAEHLIARLQTPAHTFYEKPPYATLGHLFYWNGKGGYIPSARPVRPPGYSWDVTQESQDYWAEVNKLDEAEPGRKAFRLLGHLVEHFLGETKADHFRRYGFFDVSFLRRKAAHLVWKDVNSWSEMTRLVEPEEEGWPFEPKGTIWTLRFQLRPGPYTYIIRRQQENKARWYVPRDPLFGSKLAVDSQVSFCLHPEEPYPSADILAAQFMMAISDGVGQFFHEANY